MPSALTVETIAGSIESALPEILTSDQRTIFFHQTDTCIAGTRTALEVAYPEELREEGEDNTPIFCFRYSKLVD